MTKQETEKKFREIIAQINARFEMLIQETNRHVELDLDVLRQEIRALYACLDEFDVSTINQMDVEDQTLDSIVAEPIRENEEPEPEAEPELEINPEPEIEQNSEAQVRVEKFVEEAKDVEPESNTIHEVISEQEQVLTVADKINVNDKSLSKSIGLNDKFQFINELFDSNENEYWQTLESIQEQANQDAVVQLLNGELASKYSWDTESEVFKNFQDVSTRFFN